MSLLKLDTLEYLIGELESSPAIQAGAPSRGTIQFDKAYEVDILKGEPVRFSIRVPKYALSNEQRDVLFRKVREVFSPEDRCFMQNAGDAGVLIEANANVKHKALIALWELGIYNFQFTYTYAQKA